MNVGSLFAGIGGFDLGFERAGMRTLWQVEIDPFCRRVLERHFPDAERYADVRDVGAHILAPVDVICGGFPCQDISLAGKGAGIDGERSGLWSEMWRVIRELGPRWVVVENVPALTSRGLDRVLRDLAQGGYDAEWDCLPASAFGAPHRRDRVWIVAYPQGESIGTGLREGEPGGQRRGRPGDGGGAGDVPDSNGPGREVRSGDGMGALAGAIAGQSARPGGADASDSNGSGRPTGEQDLPARQPDPVGSRRDLADSEGDGCGPGRARRPDPASAGQREPKRPLQDTDSSAVQPWRVGGRATQASGAEWWAAEPPVGRVAHGVPDRLDQLAALGNALVPQIAEWIGCRILEWEQVT